MGKKIRKEEYKLQYYIKGQPTFLYWSDSGLCYFIDHKNQVLEIASNEYRNAKLGEAFVEGILTKNEDGDIIFVLNDCCHYQGRSYRNSNLEERSKIAIELMEELGVPNGPIQFAINPIKDITTSNLKQKFDNIVLDGCKIPALGFMFVPKETKFHYTKKTPAYKWLLNSDEYCSRGKLLKMFK